MNNYKKNHKQNLLQFKTKMNLQEMNIKAYMIIV